MIIPKIYPITDRYLSPVPVVEQVRLIAEGGARLIQVREKGISSAEFFYTVTAAIKLCRPLGSRLIVNDRADIALAAGADGVHLGQDDLPPEEARRILGPNAIIGISTHNIDQAIAAAKMPVDYIAVGPIFPTQTKSDTEKLIGLDGIREIKKLIGSIPLVAIGGINADSFASVIKAGASSAALISAILCSGKPIDTTINELLRP